MIHSVPPGILPATHPPDDPGTTARHLTSIYDCYASIAPNKAILSYDSTMYTTFIIGKHISCTLFYTFFCTFHKKRWNNAFFVPSVQGQVRDRTSSDNNIVPVDGSIGGGTLGARQVRTWRANSRVGARQLATWRAPTCDLARQLVNLRESRPGKPTLGLFYRVGVFSAREGHETRGFSG